MSEIETLKKQLREVMAYAEDLERQRDEWEKERRLLMIRINYHHRRQVRDTLIHETYSINPER